MGDAGPGPQPVIGLDTSVIVRYLVGSPPAQARRAARLIDDDETEISVSPVALAECAHVLRTQYEVDQGDIIDSLIGLIQRENVRVLGLRADVLVEMLVRARGLPGRPIPDAMIVAASMAADALPLATFDRDQHRYGIAIREP
jgi:predicted nucleic acid-binding protein